mgnify:CR=1 FL=1
MEKKDIWMILLILLIPLSYILISFYAIKNLPTDVQYKNLIGISEIIIVIIYFIIAVLLFVKSKHLIVSIMLLIFPINFLLQTAYVRLIGSIFNLKDMYLLPNWFDNLGMGLFCILSYIYSIILGIIILRKFRVKNPINS